MMPVRAESVRDHGSLVHSSLKSALPLWPALALLSVAAGCLAPPRFDVQTRSRSFDTLWTTLDRDFVFLDSVGGLNALRDRCRAEAVAARTRRDYLRALVRLLDRFDDPHLDINNVADFWRAGGIRPQPAYAFLGFAGGHWWIELSPRSTPADDATRSAIDALVQAAADARRRSCETEADGDGQPGLDEPPVLELTEIEGARPSALSVELLAGEPGDTVSFGVRGADGVPRLLSLRIVAPPEPPPASRPAAPPARTAVRRASDSGVRPRRLENGIGLIEVTRVDGQQVVDAFDAALDRMLDTRALILDLRRNTGGNTITVERILGRFVDRIRRYGSLQWRTRLVLPLLGEVTNWSTTGMHAWPRKRCYPRPVVVLIDSTTMSGGELLAGGLRDLRGAALVGCPTIGAGAGVLRTRLPDGLVVQFGAFPMHRYDGAPIQTVGVHPDVHVPLHPLHVLTRGWRAIDEWRAATLAIAQAQAVALADQFERRGLMSLRPWP